MSEAAVKYRNLVSGLLQEGSSIPIVVPLAPIIRKFHVEVIKECINHNPLVILNDPTCLFVIGSIYCLNILRVYEDALVIILCQKEENREMFISLLLEFGIQPSQIYIELKNSGTKVKVIKKGIVFMNTNAFAYVNDTFKDANLKLLIIDEAEKAHGNSSHSKCVRHAMGIQKNFRTLGLCHNIDMKKPAIVQSVISNLSITKVYVKDYDESKFLDGILDDDMNNLYAASTLHFTVLTQLFAKGMKSYLTRLNMVSVLNETDPNFLIHGQLDEWKEKAIETPFADEARIVHALLKAYKHLIFSGSHPFYLYLQAMQSKFTAFKTTIEQTKELSSVYVHLRTVYSKLELESNREKKIQSFKHLNPKYVHLAEFLQDKFKRADNNAVLVAWSPFAVQSLTKFCKLVMEDGKKVYTSQYSDLDEDKEFKLTNNLNANYSCLEGFDVSLLVKTLHKDNRSKKVFKHVVAMDLIAVSLFRTKIGYFKTFIALKPYEYIHYRFFAKSPFLEAIKYIFREGAYKNSTPIGKFHKFDTKSFPHEFAIKLPMQQREELLTYVLRNKGKIVTSNDTTPRPSKVARKRKADEDK